MVKILPGSLHRFSDTGLTTPEFARNSKEDLLAFKPKGTRAKEMYMIGEITHALKRGGKIQVAAALALAAFVFGTATVNAQEATRLGVHESWVAFTYESSRGKVCYIVSQPLDSEPKNVRRGEIYFMVTHRPGQNIRNEVMTMIGYPFKTGSNARASIGSDNFDMFTQGEGAWVEAAETEQRIVNSMRAGARMVIAGESWRGTATTDQYSLIGVSAALTQIDEACP